MENLKEYNEKVAKAWSEGSTKEESELFFALCANKKGGVSMFWDNARGNKALIDYLKQITVMLEQNEGTNFSSQDPNIN